MNVETSTKIAIKKAKSSKISEVDFNNLPFGKITSDHMFVCDYKDGSWQQPQIIPYQNISLDPSAKIFHYGQSIFEGMKAYKDEDNRIWLFRPLENQKRADARVVISPLSLKTLTNFNFVRHHLQKKKTHISGNLFDQKIKLRSCVTV